MEQVRLAFHITCIVCTPILMLRSGHMTEEIVACSKLEQNLRFEKNMQLFDYHFKLQLQFRIVSLVRFFKIF